MFCETIQNNCLYCCFLIIVVLTANIYCTAGVSSNTSFSTYSQHFPPLNANNNGWPRANNQNGYQNVNSQRPNFGQGSATSFPSLNSNSNAWSRVNNQNVNPQWPNFGQGPTTPWPALGQRGSQNVPPSSVTQFPSPGKMTSPPTTQQQTNQGNSEDEELRQFSENLLEKDSNNAARYVTINYQGKTTSRSQNDEAPLQLLNIHPDALKISTISKLVPLHNNYIVETNMNEYVSPQEREEENDLLDAMLSTQVMQFTRNFLVQKGKIGRDPREFRDLLKTIWFNMYSRGGGKIGSSGFEHVFLGEVKNGAISGLHNWIYFEGEEAHRMADYLGYMKKIELGGKGAILKFHFKYHNLDKPVGSMFIGTSPELEMALYSTCFVLKPDQICPLRLAGNNFIIRTYTYRYRGKNMIGSAFPEI